MGTQTANRIPVLITTDKDKRGVFFGYVDERDVDKDELVAYDVQMCIYWDSSVRGVLGLATTGPSSASRVSKPIRKGLIKGVTLVADCSEDAVAAWKKQPWG